MPLADFRTLVDQELKDTANVLPPADKDKAIAEAAKVYSRFRPRERVHEITGDGVVFEWALPGDWEEGFSAIRGEVEFPAGRRRPEYLDGDDWTFYRHPSQGLRFRLVELTPQTGQLVRFAYGVRHTLTADADTVPLVDREAVGKLAASFGARSLAAYYAQTSDPTLGADVVNYRTKAQDYTLLADKLVKAFREHLGLRETDQVAPASVTADVDANLQFGGDRFFHPRRWR